MIDWDALVVGPATAIFGEPVLYLPASTSPIYTAAGILINAVFTEAYQSAGQIGDPGVISTHPKLGIQVSQLPSAFDPETAQNDRFTVQRTGKTYVVKAGHLDSRGAATLEAMESS